MKNLQQKNTHSRSVHVPHHHRTIPLKRDTKRRNKRTSRNLQVPLPGCHLVITEFSHHKNHNWGALAKPTLSFVTIVYGVKLKSAVTSVLCVYSSARLPDRLRQMSVVSFFGVYFDRWGQRRGKVTRARGMWTTGGLALNQRSSLRNSGNDKKRSHGFFLLSWVFIFYDYWYFLLGAFCQIRNKIYFLRDLPLPAAIKCTELPGKR